MFLAITPHPQFWEFQNDYINLLGEWCITDNTKNILKNKKYNIISSPWNNKKIHTEVPYCLDLVKFWMPHLANILNEAHKVNKSERYWRVLIGCWLYDYISIVYDRYLRMKKAKEEIGEFETYVLDENSYIPVMYFKHQAVIAGDDYFNLQIFSIIIRALQIKAKCVSLPQKNFDFFSTLNSVYAQGKLTSKTRLINIINKIFRDFNPFLKREIILESLLWKYKLSLSILLGQNLLHSIPRIQFPIELYSENSDEQITLKRNIFEHLPCRGEFETIAKKIIKFVFPKFYFEKYKKILEIIEPHIDKKKKLVVSVNFFTDETLKFICADTADNGARVVGVQQVGAYGVTLNMSEELIVRYITDCFIGQNSAENKEVENGLSEAVSLPMPQYIKIKDSHKCISDICILVGNDIPRYVYRVQTFLIPEQMEEYFNWKYAFLDTLREDVIGKFFYRPYPVDCGWNEIERVKARFPKISILSGGNLIEKMQKCRLVVSDHLASSYLESLVINVPTVWYWDKEIFEICPRAKDCFDLFRESGILYDSPVSAALHINGVFDNIEEWWHAKKVQHARKTFLEYLGLLSDNWQGEWVKFIKAQLVF